MPISNNPNTALQALTILVTRPEHQAEKLSKQLLCHGAHVFRLPTIDIVPSGSEEIFTQLDTFDFIIFISVNAVLHSYQIIHQLWPRFPKNLQWAAIGNSTAQSMVQQGLPVNLVPKTNFCSEGLLAQPCLQSMAAKRVLIVRGVGGRELLAQCLQQRGAEVRHAIVYRRQQPKLKVQPQLQQWQTANLNLIISTSVESLENLVQMLGEACHDWLLNTQLLVISQRMLEKARALGFNKQPILAHNASTAAIIEALVSHVSVKDRKE